MRLFIHGTGNISPQQSWDENPALTPVAVTDGRLTAMEPDYNTIIDPKLLRRMSRILRMGMASATAALKRAKVEVPDVIITGTGYGCLEDTGTFLSKMVTNKEVALNPTPFIQSTHNTIGSQIALLLQCQGYNQTYAHGALSFESALLDGLLHTGEDPSKNILIGGVDEITEISHTILSRFDLFDHSITSTAALTAQNKNRTINGEGAAFFLCSGTQRETSLAAVSNVQTFYRLPSTGWREAIRESVTSTVDLVLTGIHNDVHRQEMLDEFFPGVRSVDYKQFCGEFPVSTAFACWLAATLIAEKETLDQSGHRESAPIKSILIVNESFDQHLSLIRIEAC